MLNSGINFFSVLAMMAVGMGSALAGEHEVRAAASKGWTDGYVMANGIRIHYWRTGGDKPVMLMAHGFTDDGLCWTKLAREFEADYDIVMPDARGHGLSDPPTAVDTYDAQAEDLAGLIRELKLVKPIVMGHSMGSASAALFAATYPDVPRAVILEDPRLSSTPRRNNATSAALQEKRVAEALLKNNIPYEKIVEDGMKKNGAWGYDEIEIWALSKMRYHPYSTIYRASGSPSIEELFGKITAPVLILKADAQGEERAANEAMTARLAGGKIVHVAGAHHNVRRDQKETVVSEMKAFLGTL
jgi:pimeloyl-ACP methyl ester carboxylesterase